ncbi:MAG: DUF2062 domain-containing protein [Sphingopyxis sp.]
MSRFGKWVARNMPTREQMAQNRYLRPFAKRVLAPELWRFTRRSVPRGVALGTLIGIVVPFAQIFFAALLALPVRANVPVAGLTTFITNPLTTPLIWVLSYEVGRFVLRMDALTYGRPVTTATQYGFIADALQWITGMGPILAFGLVVVAVVSAAVGYLVSGFMWRAWVRKKWRARLKARLARVIDMIDGD